MRLEVYKGPIGLKPGKLIHLMQKGNGRLAEKADFVKAILPKSDDQVERFRTQRGF